MPDGKKKCWLDCRIAREYHVDPENWSVVKKRAWLANLPRIEALELMKTDLTRLRLADVRRIATLALDDADRGDAFAMGVLADKQIAGLEAF